MDQVLNLMQQFQNQFQQLCQEMLRMQAQLDSLVGVIRQTAGQSSGYSTTPARTGPAQPYGASYQQPYPHTQTQGAYGVYPSGYAGQGTMGQHVHVGSTTSTGGLRNSATAQETIQGDGTAQGTVQGATAQATWSSDQTTRSGSGTGRQSEYSSYGRLHD